MNTDIHLCVRGGRGVDKLQPKWLLLPLQLLNRILLKSLVKSFSHWKSCSAAFFFTSQLPAGIVAKRKLVGQRRIKHTKMCVNSRQQNRIGSNMQHRAEQKPIKSFQRAQRGVKSKVNTNFVGNRLLHRFSYQAMQLPNHPNPSKSKPLAIYSST